MIVALFGRQVFPFADLLAAIQQRVMRWGMWSAIGYPLLYACCNVLLLPGGILSLGGGFFFGLWWGFIIILVGNVAGAALSFFLSRFAGRRWLGRKLQRHPTFKALEPAVRREVGRLFAEPATSTVPDEPAELPLRFNKHRFRTCMLWVALARPRIFLYAYLGTLGAAGIEAFRGKTHPELSNISLGRGSCRWYF